MDQKRMLLIENHSILRQALHQLLSSAGYEVVDEATDMVDGICLAVSQQPAFIILDSSIAELNAMAFSGMIHRLVPNSKVILLVDDAREYDGLEEAQRTNYVNKRTVTQDLPALLHHWSN